MSQLGRLHDILHRQNGTPAAGATVEVRRQGATITSNQSSTAPHAFAVADLGDVRAGDTVVVNTGATTYAVTAVATGLVTLDGYAGTLALNQGDRLSPVNNLPTLYADAQAVNTLAGGNPMETDVRGEFAAWADSSPYDLYVTGGGYETRLFQDVWPAGITRVRITADPDPSGKGYIFDTRRLPSTGHILSLELDGVEVFYVKGDGTISGTISVSVPDPLTLVNGLTVGGVVTANGGMGVVGGLTVDNFTGTGTFTVAPGAIASAALANNAATAAPVITRGGAAAVLMTTTEAVRISVSKAVASTTSNVRITYEAPYYNEVVNTHIAYGVVRLYIDGVLAFPIYFGNVAHGGGADTLANFHQATLIWVATGLSAASHTFEIRDLKVNTVGTSGIVQYRGDLVQGALIIEEDKK